MRRIKRIAGRTFKENSPFDADAVFVNLIAVVSASVSYKFGLVCMAAGASGVPLGSWAAQRLRAVVAHCDPVICGGALLASAPLVYFALIAVSAHAALTFLLIFLGMITLNLTWSIVADIVLVSAFCCRCDVRLPSELFPKCLLNALFYDSRTNYLRLLSL